MSIVSFFLTTLSMVFYFFSNLLNGGNPILGSNDIKDVPVCVVGAGISGLNVAGLLQKKGYVVQVFEKKGTVGGKMITYREGDEILVEMAPVFFTRSSLSIMNKVLEYGLTPVPFNESDAGYFDGASGRLFPRSFTAEEVSQLSSASIRYSDYYSQYKEGLRFGYLDASPDIFEPFSNWLESRNLTALRPIFTLAMTVEGYGALEEIPALYALKFVTPEFLGGIGTFAGSFSFVGEGLDVLATKMASSLTTYLNTEMIRISREGRHPTVVFRDENSGRYSSQKCKAVILAFPPLLPNLEKIIVDLSEEEKKILVNAKIHRYTSAAHHIPSLQQSLYYDPVPKGAGEVVALVRQSSKKRKDIYSSYSWIRGDFDSGPSVSDLLTIEKHLEKFLNTINRNSTTLQRTALEYFPHVGSEALNNGFYQKFNSMQGNGGIFYATTLLSFETMDSALEMTEAFVEKFF